MIIGLLLRRHVLESFAGPSSIHIGKSLSPFLRSFGIQRTKTDCTKMGARMPAVRTELGEASSRSNRCV